MSAKRMKTQRAKTVRTIARLELRILRRDRAALAVLGFFAGLLLLAAYTGGHRAHQVSDGLDRALSAQTQHFVSLHAQLAKLEATQAPPIGQDPRDPSWMGREGAARLATLPPAPLAAVAIGQRDLFPQALRVNTEVFLTTERETETPMSGPTRLTTGAFDPAFLFVVLFPLVIIALSYELLSGERERGTLAMLLSQPISQRALVLGKASARFGVLCLVTLSIALGGLLVAGVDVPNAGLEVGLYLAILVAWALFWFAAAMAVNAFGRSSASNALLLFGLWLLVVVVVPGLVRVGVDTLYPPPSRVEMLHEAREAAQEMERELAGLEGQHDQDTKTQAYAEKMVKVQTDLAQRAAPVLADLRAQLAQRQSLLDGLRFLSPAMVVHLALEDVAGTGARRHQRFEAQVDGFHDRFRSQLFDTVRAGTRLDAAQVKAIPQWTFDEEPASDLVSRVLSGVLGLLLASLLLLGLAMRGLRRVGRLAG